MKKNKRDIFPSESEEVYRKNIGKEVYKDQSGKPFKSGLLFNTVKDVIIHPILKIPAYTFFEDESYVECRRCLVLGVFFVENERF